MAKVTQKERVLEAMRTHHTKSISPWYAINHLGNTRLAATIHTLKKEGYNITSETVKGKNKFGDTISYAKYTLNDVD